MSRPRWLRAWKRGGWIRLLSGATLSPSTARRGLVSWIASLPASRANRGATPARERARVTNGGSGPPSPGWFARWERASSSWRTCPVWYREVASRQCSVTWPPSGSMRNGRVYQRPKLELPTDATGFSFSPPTGMAELGSVLPTPTAASYGSNQGGAAGRTGKVRHSLESMAKLPTPTAADSRGTRTEGYGNPKAGTTLTDMLKAGLPTPTARDWKSGCSNITRNRRPLNETLSQAGHGPRLNPAFVEWMMGLPPAWTELELAGTVSSRSKPPLPLQRSQEG